MHYKAPKDYSDIEYDVCVFLAGSIEMDTAEKWQDRVAKEIQSSRTLVLNPRRDDWDSSWTARTSNKQFAEQVSWEHDGLHNSDIVFMYFDPKTKSPITLLELGLMADSGKLIVCCADDFWRKGNVEYICEEYGISLYTKMEDAIAELKERVKEYANMYEQYRM